MSPEMRRCLTHIKANGYVIHRHPGGFWAAKDWTGPHDGPYFKTTTIIAMVQRNLLAYDLWNESQYGKFPIRATITEKGLP